MSDTRPKINPDVQAAMKVLLDSLNTMGGTGDIVHTMLDTILREHRTIQQSFWSAMIQTQIKYADAPSDMRNYHAVELAKVVKAAAIENNFDMGLPRV